MTGKNMITGGLASILGGVGAAIGVALALGGVVAFITLLFATSTFMHLLVKVGYIVAPLVGLGLLVSLFVGLPLLIFRRTRPASTLIFTVEAWGMGILIWMLSLIAIYDIWGRFMAIVGVILMPLIVPLAMIAGITGGRWDAMGPLFGAVVAWCLLIAGSTLASRNS